MIFLKKYDVIQLVAVVKSLLKITVSLKSQLIKKAKDIAGKILTLLIKLCLLLYLRKILYISFPINILTLRVQ